VCVVSVISSVLAQQQVIDKREVKVNLYYSYLSHTTSTSRKQPVTIPQDIVILLEDLKSKFIRHSDKFRAQLEAELAASHCAVKWPDDEDSDKLTLQCTVKEEDVGAAEQVHNWTDTCQTIADNLLASIATASDQVCGEIWTKFLDETKSAAQSELTELYIEEDDNSFNLSYVGVGDSVAKFRAAAVDVSKRLMVELAKAKSMKFEVISNLSAAQLQIIKTSRFWDAMSTGVEVSFDGHRMSLQGTEAEIMAFKVRMYEEIVNRIQSKASACDQFKLKLLRKPDVMQYFQSIFKQKKLNVACTVTANDLVVHGLDDTSINEAGAMLDRELSQAKVPLDSASSAALNIPQWKSVETALLNSSKILDIAVAADKMSVSCCGIRDEVETAEAKIKEFFQQNTIVEQFVALPEGKVIYIRKHLWKEVDDIVKSLTTDAVKLEPIEDGKKSGFVVRGTRRGLEQATREVVELSKDILEVVHDSDLPGTQKYFTTKRGKDSLTALENRSKVVVLVSEELLSQEGSDGGATLAASAPTIKSEVYVSVSGTMIRVLKSSVSECYAEALIVTIGDNLKHTEGAARLIAAAGRPILTDHGRNQEFICGMFSSVPFIPLFCFSSFSFLLSSRFVVAPQIQEFGEHCS